MQRHGDFDVQHGGQLPRVLAMQRRQVGGGVLSGRLRLRPQPRLPGGLHLQGQVSHDLQHRGYEKRKKLNERGIFGWVFLLLFFLLKEGNILFKEKCNIFLKCLLKEGLHLQGQVSHDLQHRGYKKHKKRQDRIFFTEGREGRK